MRSQTLRSLPILAAVLLGASCSRDATSPALTGPIKLTPPRLAQGQVIRTTVKTIAPGGRFTSSSPDMQTGGTLSLERVRIVEQTIDEADNGVPTAFRIVVLEDSLETTVRSEAGDRSDSVTSPLVGRTLIATKEDGKWKLRFTTGETGPAEEEELIPLEGFANRSWVPGHAVQPGDSWEYDPVYFRNLIERDIGAADAVGVMTLRSVETNQDGDTEARIDLAISTEGAENTGTATLREAGIEATGSLVIDLETMLEKKLTVEGTLVSGVPDGSSRASVELPVRIELTREFVQ